MAAGSGRSPRLEGTVVEDQGDGLVCIFLPNLLPIGIQGAVATVEDGQNGDQVYGISVRGAHASECTFSGGAPADLEVRTTVDGAPADAPFHLLIPGGARRRRRLSRIIGADAQAVRLVR